MNKLLKTRGATVATAQTSGSTPRPRRILVVEDDPYLCQLSADVLIRQGYEVNAVENHTAGWQALQADAYDLLIADLDPPGWSGVKLVKQLRAARLAVPVILASGVMTPRELNRNPWLRLSGALLKPFSPDQLLQTVQAVLRAPDAAREPVAPPPDQARPAVNRWFAAVRIPPRH